MQSCTLSVCVILWWPEGFKVSFWSCYNSGQSLNTWLYIEDYLYSYKYFCYVTFIPSTMLQFIKHFSISTNTRFKKTEQQYRKQKKRSVFQKAFSMKKPPSNHLIFQNNSCSQFELNLCYLTLAYDFKASYLSRTAKSFCCSRAWTNTMRKCLLLSKVENNAIPSSIFGLQFSGI